MSLRHDSIFRCSVAVLLPLLTPHTGVGLDVKARPEAFFLNPNTCRGFYQVSRKATPHSSFNTCIETVDLGLSSMFGTKYVMFLLGVKHRFIFYFQFLFCTSISLSLPCLFLSEKESSERVNVSRAVSHLWLLGLAVRWKVERSREARSNNGCCNSFEWDLLREICASERPCILHRHSVVFHSSLHFFSPPTLLFSFFLCE